MYSVPFGLTDEVLMVGNLSWAVCIFVYNLRDVMFYKS